MKKKAISLIAIGMTMCMMSACSSIETTPKEITINVNTSQPTSDTTAPVETAPVESAGKTEAFEKDPYPSSPAENPSVNLLNNMSQEQKTEVNKFLSNFSESFYGLNYSEPEAKIHFAFTHSLINRSQSTIKYENNEMGISAAEVDEILVRFFGSSIPHETPYPSEEFVYKDGYFMMRAASGESHSYFSIATDMTALADGNYKVNFSVFFDNLNIHDMLQSWYSLSYNDVVSNSQYSYEYDGEAILKAKGSTYEIVSYKVNS